MAINQGGMSGFFIVKLRFICGWKKVYGMVLELIMSILGINFIEFFGRI